MSYFYLSHDSSVDQAIPTEIRSEARKLKHEIDLDVQDVTETPSIDDEYANLGHREPKVCVSTSRDPSSRLDLYSHVFTLIYFQIKTICQVR